MSLQLLPLLVVFVLAGWPAKTIITPFGVRPSGCVIEVDHDSTVTPLANNANVLQISHPTKGVQYHHVPKYCSEDIAEIKQRYADKQARRDAPTSETDPQAINGWLDYGGWYPPQGENNLQSFTSTYIVPGNPPTVGSQVLFYFIGMQDNDSPSAVNIIQPVLTWGNGYQQWYMQSWACCPSNITVHSPPLFGLGPGSSVLGTIQRVSASTWSIDSAFNGKHTTLNAQVGDYIYNWADVTLEVYTVNQCGQFAPGRAWFNKLDLTDNKGEKLIPRWQFTAPTSCGGQISQVASDSVYIQHTPA